MKLQYAYFIVNMANFWSSYSIIAIESALELAHRNIYNNTTELNTIVMI